MKNIANNDIDNIYQYDILIMIANTNILEEVRL